MKKRTKLDAVTAAKNLKRFMSKSQLQVMTGNIRSEEGQFFIDKMVEMADLFASMPATGETDGQGDNAIAHLHYFHGNMDWYITERDMLHDQHQAFGYANIGYGYECGYISLVELAENNIELDLHFTPKPVGEATC